MNGITTFLLSVSTAFLLAFSPMQQTDIDGQYPGHPPTNNEAAKLNCGPPPAPNGAHWEYVQQCTLDNIANHEREWKAAQKVAQESRDAVQAQIDEAEEELASLEALRPQVPPAELPRFEGMVAEKKAEIRGLRRGLGAVTNGWVHTQNRLNEEFYTAIKDCCRIVED